MMSYSVVLIAAVVHEHGCTCSLHGYRIPATYVDIRDTAMWQRQEASLLTVTVGRLLLNP